VKYLILFGGRARGDNFVTSDFDFIIVSDDFLGVSFVKRAAKLYELWQSSRDLEILCYTLEEWHRSKNKRGILLNAQQERRHLL
jgi:predicted nucleotidyltransferase